MSITGSQRLNKQSGGELVNSKRKNCRFCGASLPQREERCTHCGASLDNERQQIIWGLYLVAAFLMFCLALYLAFRYLAH